MAHQTKIQWWQFGRAHNFRRGSSPSADRCSRLAMLTLSPGIVAIAPANPPANPPAIIPPSPTPSSTPTRLKDLSLPEQAEQVAQRLEGILDTAEQARQNPGKSNVQMTSCRIQSPLTAPTIATTPLSQETDIWLYQEQAIAPNLDQPYRQRILLISPSPYSKSIRSRAYKPPQPSTWINYCQRQHQTPQPTITDLGPALCQVYLRPVGIDFIGQTPPTGCPTTARGAVRITNYIVLRSDGMDTWDRGFDATGKQIWGAKQDAYLFQKRSSTAQIKRD